MRARAVALIASLLVLSLVAAGQAFVHPGILNNQAELNFWVSKVAASQEPWLSAFNELHNITAYTPQASGVLNMSGSVDEFDAPLLRADCAAALDGTLQFFGTGIQARANKAIEILNWLATHVTGCTGAHCSMGWPFYTSDCVFAAELLKYATPDSGWSTADENAFGNWLKTEAEPGTIDTDISDDGQGSGNKAALGAMFRMAIGIFTNTQSLYDQGLSDAKALLRYFIGCQFNTVNRCGLPNVTPAFSKEVCRQGNTTLTMAGGDMIHTQTAFGGLVMAAEIAKHQGVDLYAYKHTTTPPAPADQMGLQDGLLYIDQWLGFNQGRSGSSATGWPCGTPLAQVETSATVLWITAGNHYGNSGQIDDLGTYLQTRNLSNVHQRHVALTQWYNQGGGPVTDTTPPTQPTLALASKTPTSISLTASGSTDAIGVTSYRWMHTAGACGNPTSAQVFQTTPGPSVTHSGLAASSVHCYRVDSRDAEGNDSPDSATLQVTTDAVVTIPPVAGLFVSLTGNDSNPGTQASPFRTLSKACQVVVPGGTIFFRGGTYTFTATPSCKSGTSDTARITIKPFPGETIIWTGGWRFTTGDLPNQTRYQSFEGEYDAVTDTRTFIMDNSGVKGVGDFIRLKNVEVKNGTAPGTLNLGNNFELINVDCHHNGTSAGSHCMYSHGSHGLVDGGKFHHNSGYGLHLYNGTAGVNPPKPPCDPGIPDTASTPNGCGSVEQIVRNAHFYGNGICGLIIKPGTRPLVYNNLFYENDGCGAVLEATGTQLYHNTFYRNNRTRGTGQLLIGAACDNCVVQNNLIWGTSKLPIELNSGAIGSRIDHNLLGQPTPPEGDPLVVNATALDFHLASNSPAINAGFALPPMFAKDKDGATRPVGSAWDIGAYEFGGTAPSCTKPGNDCTPPSVPPAPSIVRDSTTQVTLNWPDSTGSPTDYHVRQCELGTGETTCAPSTIIASPVLSAQTVTNLTPDKTYFWTVSALDANANESESSPAVQMTMTAPVADAIAPSVPTAVACSASSATQISCTWPAAVDNPGGTGVAGYQVQSCTGVACSPVDPFETTASASYTKSNLSASTVYGFRVAAFDAASPANVSAYSTPPASATTPAAAVVAESVYAFDNNCSDSGNRNLPCTPTGITYTTTAAQLTTGSSHAAVFDADADVITVPTTNLVNPNQFSIIIPFYATALPVGEDKNLLGHVSAPPPAAPANRLLVRLTPTGLIELGLGQSSNINSDLFGTPILTNTLYVLYLTLDTGAYRVRLARDTVGFLGQAIGTYSGLTTFGSVLCVGNNCQDQTNGFPGSIDRVRLLSRPLTTAEEDSDCAALIDGCGAPLPPTFDPLVLVSGAQGDGLAAAQNTTLSVLFSGTIGPDPTACADLLNWDLTYETTRQPLASCAISGTAGQLQAVAPPPLPTTPLTLTYVPTGQGIALTNSTVVDVTAGVGLEQWRWWCRRPGLSPLIAWHGPLNTVCHVPSPGLVDVQLDLRWTGAGASPAQEYALYCDATPHDEIDQAVRVGTAFNQYGALPLRYKAQGTSQLVLSDGDAIAPVFPPIAGQTAVSGGVMHRTEAALSSPVLATNQYVEDRYALEVAPGVPLQTTFACERRPASGGVRLDSVVPALIRVGAAQFVSQ